MQILQPHTPEEDKQAQRLARRFWARIYGTPRKADRKTRLDAGRKHKLTGDTEAAFLRKRRADVAALHAPAPFDLTGLPEPGEVGQNGWTASHAKEVAVQDQTRARRLVGCAGR